MLECLGDALLPVELGSAGEPLQLHGSIQQRRRAHAGSGGGSGAGGDGSGDGDGGVGAGGGGDGDGDGDGALLRLTTRGLERLLQLAVLGVLNGLRRRRWRSHRRRGSMARRGSGLARRGEQHGCCSLDVSIARAEGGARLRLRKAERTEVLHRC